MTSGTFSEETAGKRCTKVRDLRRRAEPVDEAFDSIGVVDADLVAGDGEVFMAYVGTNGASRAVGLAWREGFMGGP